MKKSPGKDFWLFFPGEYSLIYVLFFQDLKCTLDLLHAFLITKGTVIQAQIIFRHVCPVNTHETFAEIFFAFVILMHKFLNILCSSAEFLTCLTDTEIPVSVNKHTKNIGIILQDHICTTSDDHTGLCFCQLPDHLCLIIKQVLIGCKILALRRDQLTLVDSGLCKKSLLCADIFICPSNRAATGSSRR